AVVNVTNLSCRAPIAAAKVPLANSECTLSWLCHRPLRVPVSYAGPKCLRKRSKGGAIRPGHHVWTRTSTRVPRQCRRILQCLASPHPRQARSDPCRNESAELAY